MKTFTPPQLLLVEDDPILGEGLTLGLKLEDYEVFWEENIKSAQLILSKKQFDLIILDIGLPDGQGTDLCKTIRETNLEVPIIFLTAQTDEETLIHALELGANDFVKKPFSSRELMARIKVLLRPKRIYQNVLSFQDLKVLIDDRQTFYQDKEILLNRRQFDILVYFLKHQDQIVTREQLLTHLNDDGQIYDRTIDSHLSQLRKILKTNNVSSLQINSIYGIGYRLEASAL